LTIRQFRLSPLFVLSLLISKISSDGSLPGTASAPLRKFTSTSPHRTPFNSLTKALGASFPRLTRFFGELGKAGIFHP